MAANDNKHPNKLPNGRFLKIDELFAFVSIDAEGEGIVGFRGPGGQWFPLVGADMERVESMKVFAQKIANMSGEEISIRRFSTMTEIGKISPAPTEGN